MCTFTSTYTEAELGLSASTQAGADKVRTEAEHWRTGAGFGRNEVNLTRSGNYNNTSLGLIPR